MGHSRHSRKKSSKPRVGQRKPTVVAMMDDGKVNGVPKVGPTRPQAASQSIQSPAPQLGLHGSTPHSALAGLVRDMAFEKGQLYLSDKEWDSLFCMAIRHHFEQEKVWIPSVLRTMPLLEGINDKTGRPCRIYVRPGRRITMVETLL